MIRQFTKESVCVKCQGCCRFSDSQTPWSPRLLDTEIKTLPKLTPVKLSGQEGFFCPLLDIPSNKCKAYPDHPFDCQLYPFVLNRKAEKVYLAVDPNCPYAKDNLETKEFKEYVSYLLEALSGKELSGVLARNQHLIQSYKDVVNIEGIDI